MIRSFNISKKKKKYVDIYLKIFFFILCLKLFGVLFIFSLLVKEVNNQNFLFLFFILYINCSVNLIAKESIIPDYTQICKKRFSLC